MDAQQQQNLTDAADMIAEAIGQSFADPTVEFSATQALYEIAQAVRSLARAVRGEQEAGR
jgi:hypothetical protein